MLKVAIALQLALSALAAIEPSQLHKEQPVPPAPAPVAKQADPIGSFILPSFGVSVSYRPAVAAEPKQPPVPVGQKPAAAPPAAPAKTTPAAVVVQTPKPSTEEALKKKEQEEERKQREQEEKKAKKEAEELKRKQQKEGEDLKKKQQKELEDLKRKREDEEKRKKQADQKPTNQLKTNNNKRKRSPVATKYEVPSGAGIAGVGGGVVPDPGFVLEPRDLFQKAENAGSLSALYGTGLMTLLTLAGTLVLLL